jgi:REP element-mobilizing transposase RayT
MTRSMLGSHSVFLMHAHIVWVTKYLKKIHVNEIAEAAREQIRRICAME